MRHVPLLLLVAGCDALGPIGGPGCTELGCEDGYNLLLAGDLGTDWSVTLDLGEGPEGCTSVAGEVTCDDPLTYDDNVVYGDGVAGSIDVVITVGDVIVVDEAVEMNVQPWRPNGPSCDPECQVASGNVSWE